MISIDKSMPDQNMGIDELRTKNWTNTDNIGSY